MNTRLQKIHEASVSILEKTGIKFLNAEAIEIFKSNGLRVEGDIVYFTEEQLMHWVKKAPSSFTIHARNPKYNMVVGGDNVYYAPGGGASLMVDQSGVKRMGTLDDYAKMSKLFHVNPRFSSNACAAIHPCEADIDSVPLTFFYMDYCFSDKVMMIKGGNAKQMQDTMDLALVAYGDDIESFKAEPKCFVIINAITPLRYDSGMLDTLICMAKYGQPVVVNSAGMAGTTSPITLAGTLAIVNAEVLAGIALTQMINPGTPAVYGTQTATADLRNGSMAIGSPEGALCYKYGALLAKFYDLPCRGGGAISDSKIVDAQAGYESMMNLMVCKDNKMNIILHAGGILDGFSCMSYEKVIMDFEVVEFVERFAREFEIDDETIPLELIDEVAHEGQYLTEMHTLEFCRSEPLTPFVSVRGVTTTPEQLMINIQNRLETLLNSYKMPDNDPVVIEKMQAVMLAAGVPKAEMAKIQAIIV